MKKIKDISIQIIDGNDRGQSFVLFVVGQEIPLSENNKKTDVVVKITVLFGVIRIYFSSGMVTKYKGFKYIHSKR